MGRNKSSLSEFSLEHLSTISKFIVSYKCVYPELDFKQLENSVSYSYFFFSSRIRIVIIRPCFFFFVKQSENIILKCVRLLKKKKKANLLVP